MPADPKPVLQPVADFDLTLSDEPLGGTSSATFEALGLPIYRILWFGTLFSFLAFNMSGTAQAVVAFDLTGTNRAVGIVVAGQGIAMLLLNPFGGAIADRLSKKYLVMFAQASIGVVMLAIAILIASGHISVPILALGSLVVGMMFSFNGPSRTALVGEIVPKAKIGNAMALVQVANSSARISGPFFAGILLAAPFVGSAGVYFIIAAIFIIVLATLARIPNSKPVARPRSSVLQDVRAGIAYVARRPRLLHSVVSFYFLATLGFAYFVLMPGFARQSLHTSTFGLGVLLGLDAVGGLTAGLIVASRAGSPRAPVYLMLASLLTGLGLVALGFAPNFLAASLLMVLIGAGAAGFQTLNNAMSIRISDPAYYGRVIGLMFFAWGLNNLFSLPLGFLGDAFGVRAVLTGMGVCLSLVTVGLSFWLYRLTQSEKGHALHAVAPRAIAESGLP